jgi:hypothetical protein
MNIDTWMLNYLPIVYFELNDFDIPDNVHYYLGEYMRKHFDIFEEMRILIYKNEELKKILRKILKKIYEFDIKVSDYPHGVFYDHHKFFIDDFLSKYSIKFLKSLYNQALFNNMEIDDIHKEVSKMGITSNKEIDDLINMFEINLDL